MYLVINIDNCSECMYFKASISKSTVLTACTKSKKTSCIKVADSERLKTLGVGIPEDCPLKPNSVKMTREEFDSLETLIENHRKENPEERRGQALFNVLFENFTEIAEIVRGTRYDTFYHDEKIPLCYEFIYSMFVKE